MQVGHRMFHLAEGNALNSHKILRQIHAMKSYSKSAPDSKIGSLQIFFIKFFSSSRPSFFEIRHLPNFCDQEEKAKPRSKSKNWCQFYETSDKLGPIWKNFMDFLSCPFALNLV